MDERVLSDEWEIVKRYIDYFVVHWVNKNEVLLNRIYDNFFNDHLLNH